ncbi:MAG: DUF1573 domain-containing protein [Chitinispirillia bacterium]|nr:DUF1573 domain-containing protein [Chitinispirillia bacterium]MCL2268666.1 DUF1573 domain-containing protein [Chitinispirillia bacterium]
MLSSIRICARAVLAAGALISVFAAPQVQVDNMTFNGGPINEGSTVHATFKLTNTGDQPLRITNVRPGCGCTVVSYDSVIAPGKTGVIKPKVDLKGMRPGHMNRGVTVTSNAANTPTLQLIIEATILPIIEVSENYLTFPNAAKKTITLASAKKDLKISGIVFTPHESGRNTPGWASNVPLTLSYTFTATDSTRAGGLNVYKLDITPPGAGGDPVNGAFLITTNHPDKGEIVINGRIQ